MNIDRARKIAASFAGSVSLNVYQLHQGLLVQYRQSTYYFTREPSFWAYIFKLANVVPATANSVQACGG